MNDPANDAASGSKSATTPVPSGEVLDELVDHLEEGKKRPIRRRLRHLHAADIANLLESLPITQRIKLWALMPSSLVSDVLPHLRQEVRDRIVEDMEPEAFIAAAEKMAVEDLAEVLDTLPEDLADSVVENLDEDRQRRLRRTWQFAEQTAGRLMSQDVVSVRKDVSVAVVLRYLRRHPRLPPHTDKIMVTDPDNRYEGTLSLATLLTCHPEQQVQDVMDHPSEHVHANVKDTVVATLFERRDLISVAVVDEQHRLLGRITIDDIVDVIRRDADRAMLGAAGLDEQVDLFAPVLSSAGRRGLWLGINLLTVLLASWVIGRFERVLDQIVALAVLMPIVASMGGIAGSQTLTLTIRGQALGQIAATNVRWLSRKELAVAALNGVTWALLVALIVQVWFRDTGITVVIAAAMMVNLLVAGVAGLAIPLVMRRFNLDPALSGTVVLTTITDIVGFLSFLGLASWTLL